MKQHEFMKIHGLDSCQFKEMVIDGYVAQCCEPESASIHKKRLKLYVYKGFRVHHYVEGVEQFIACAENCVLRAETKEEIENAIDSQ